MVDIMANRFLHFEPNLKSVGEDSSSIRAEDFLALRNEISKGNQGSSCNVVVDIMEALTNLRDDHVLKHLRVCMQKMTQKNRNERHEISKA
jgi:hypothetical protein